MHRLLVVGRVKRLLLSPPKSQLDFTPLIFLHLGSRASRVKALCSHICITSGNQGSRRRLRSPATPYQRVKAFSNRQTAHGVGLNIALQYGGVMPSNMHNLARGWRIFIDRFRFAPKSAADASSCKGAAQSLLGSSIEHNFRAREEGASSGSGLEYTWGFLILKIWDGSGTRGGTNSPSSNGQGILCGRERLELGKVAALDGKDSRTGDER